VADEATLHLSGLRVVEPHSDWYRDQVAGGILLEDRHAVPTDFEERKVGEERHGFDFLSAREIATHSLNQAVLEFGD
jgi:hypothetical protein